MRPSYAIRPLGEHAREPTAGPPLRGRRSWLGSASTRRQRRARRGRRATRTGSGHRPRDAPGRRVRCAPVPAVRSTRRSARAAWRMGSSARRGRGRHRIARPARDRPGRDHTCGQSTRSPGCQREVGTWRARSARRSGRPGRGVLGAVVPVERGQRAELRTTRRAPHQVVVDKLVGKLARDHRPLVRGLLLGGRPADVARLIPAIVVGPVERVQRTARRKSAGRTRAEIVPLGADRDAPAAVPVAGPAHAG